MLNASISDIMFTPSVAAEGDTVTATADATGTGLVFYEWSLTQDDTELATGYAEEFDFVPPDDGQYVVTLTVTDARQTSATRIEQLDVNNVAPLVELSGPASVAEGSAYTLAVGPVSDPGTDTVSNYVIHWGDGQTQGLTAAELGGGLVDHTYADGPNLYTITIDLVDEDGTYNAVDSLEVEVTNVAPALTGTEDLVVKEGQAFTLTSLGVGISDPGFDRGDGVETFDVMKIVWGDGTSDDNGDGDPTDLVTVVNRQSPDGGPTTAAFEHVAHTYADGGREGTDYSVTITLKDDDGQWVDRKFAIHVENVAPSLSLTEEALLLDEGSTLVIANLGTFSDPGFNNPDNPLSPPDGSRESFTYTIDWGDRTPVETGRVPASVADGGPGLLTTGTLADSHFYADNDADNRYTITVTLSDDDGGSDTQWLEVIVNNVNPVLQPVTATDVESSGRTTLDLTFSDPGADQFQVMVDWGERLNLPAEERFVVATVHAGPTPQSFTLEHYYAGPPDPLHPTADITITVKIFDDDVGTPGVIQSGISNLESVTISNPGIEEHHVRIDTTPDVPRLEFVQQATLVTAPIEAGTSTLALQTPDVRVARSELGVTTERYLELRVVHPDGTQSRGYRLKDEALADLRGLFATLPDNRYVIYLVRTENNSRRIVIEVDVRRGRPIDTADESEGTRDRPPTSEAPTGTAIQPLEDNPMLDAQPEDPADGAPAQTTPEKETGGQRTTEHAEQGEEAGESVSVSPHRLVSPAPSAGLLLALAGNDRWSSQLDEALERADGRAWQRLRRAGRLGRVPANKR